MTQSYNARPSMLEKKGMTGNFICTFLLYGAVVLCFCLNNQPDVFYNFPNEYVTVLVFILAITVTVALIYEIQSRSADREKPLSQETKCPKCGWLLVGSPPHCPVCKDLVDEQVPQGAKKTKDGLRII